jgi:4'-phosphopantetheinyl transferase EntD
MIEKILPASVASAEAFEDRDDGFLFPDERKHVARSVATRRREFMTGRACARAALSQLGFPPQPIGVGDRGQPKWPAGSVGSITHCAGYRASAAGLETEFLALGIDAERNAPLPEQVPITTIALPQEIRQLPGLREVRPDIHWDRLLFSAKEATYKAWFALAGERLGFHDGQLEIDATSSNLRARLPETSRRDFSAAVLSGRWLATPSFILTVITVPADARAVGLEDVRLPDSPRPH